MAERACHVFGSTTQVGSTQALDFTGEIIVIKGTSIALTLLLSACASTPHSTVNSSNTPMAAERGFAASMAARNFDSFASYIDEDAVFINGGKPLRGKEAILKHWKQFFTSPKAPFAWEPTLVEISARNGMGYTQGPVTLEGGKVIATFYSTWKVQPDGSWKVVFDNGYDVCDCKK